MNYFYINRSAGDIIYALPAIKAAGGGHIITGLPIDLHNALKPLLIRQALITGISHLSEGVPPGTVCLEDFRYHPETNKKHLCEIFAEILDVKIEYKEGWLCRGYEPPGISRYSIINITDRYRDKIFKWWKEIAFLGQDTVYFIGTRLEYNTLRNVYGWKSFQHLPTKDFDEVAQLILYARHFSGTQSACLAIAEGLGRAYRYERSPFWDNVRTGTERETILNNRTRKIHFAISRIQEICRNFKA